MKNLADAREHVAKAERELEIADGLLRHSAEIASNHPIWAAVIAESTARSTNASAHLSAAVQIRMSLAGPR